MLALCTSINKELGRGNEDPSVVYLQMILAIYEGAKMLYKTDVHRTQVGLMLKQSMKYGGVLLTKIGVEPDFSVILDAISSPDKPPLIYALNLTSDFGKGYALDFISPTSAENYENVRTLGYEGWTTMLDENAPHYRYSKNMDAFKTNFKVSSLSNLYIYIYICYSFGSTFISN